MDKTGGSVLGPGTAIPASGGGFAQLWPTQKPFLGSTEPFPIALKPFRVARKWFLSRQKSFLIAQKSFRTAQIPIKEAQNPVEAIQKPFLRAQKSFRGAQKWFLKAQMSQSGPLGPFRGAQMSFPEARISFREARFSCSGRGVWHQASGTGHSGGGEEQGPPRRVRLPINPSAASARSPGLRVLSCIRTTASKTARGTGPRDQDQPCRLEEIIRHFFPGVALEDSLDPRLQTTGLQPEECRLGVPTYT